MTSSKRAFYGQSIFTRQMPAEPSVFETEAYRQEETGSALLMVQSMLPHFWNCSAGLLVLAQRILTTWNKRDRRSWKSLTIKSAYETNDESGDKTQTNFCLPSNLLQVY